MNKKQLRKVRRTIAAMGPTGLRINGNGEFVYQFTKTRVAIDGATVAVDQGHHVRRVTAGRFAFFGLLAFAGKKDMSKTYLTISGADGSTILISVKQQREGAARQFAMMVNTATWNQ